ncbi:MAG: response regulator transcription factor [Ignavibacteriales bacterium]
MSPSVLIVDDEPSARNILKRHLQRLDGYSVAGEARDGQEALDLARRLNPDIIVMDIKMPNMDGIAASRVIKQEAPDCAILFVTAYDDFEYARSALRLGAEDYLLKPVKPEQFSTALSAVTRKLTEAKRDREYVQSLARTFNSFEPVLAREFVVTVLSGDHLSMTRVLEWARIFRFESVPDTVIVVDLLGYRNSSPVSQKLPGIIRHVSDSQACSIAAFNEGSRVIGVIRPARPAPQQVRRSTSLSIAEALRQEFRRSLEHEATVVVGGPCADLQGLSAEYVLACAALCSLCGRNLAGTFHCRDVSITPPESRQARPCRKRQELEASLSREIASGDFAASKELAASILRAAAPCTHREHTLSALKARGFSLLALLGYAALDAGVPPEVVVSYRSSAEAEMFRCNSLEQMLTTVQSFIDGIPSLSQGGSLSLSDIVESAQRFIETNYSKSLGIKEVAAHVHLSPYYFARVFKNQAGVTILEYITRVRLERAASLLKRSTLPIRVISSKCGYVSCSYFSQIFRKEYGCSPTEYRERISQPETDPGTPNGHPCSP